MILLVKHTCTHDKTAYTYVSPAKYLPRASIIYFIVDDFPFGSQAGLRAQVACCRATLNNEQAKHNQATWRASQSPLSPPWRLRYCTVEVGFIIRVVRGALSHSSSRIPSSAHVDPLTAEPLNPSSSSCLVRHLLFLSLGLLST